MVGARLAVGIVQAELGEPLPAGKAGAAHHGFERSTVGIPPGEATRLAHEACQRFRCRQRIDNRCDDGRLPCDRPDAHECAGWIRQVQQHTATEDEIKEADAVGVDVIDIDHFALGVGTDCVMSELVRVMQVLLGARLRHLRGILRAKIVRQPLREFGGSDQSATAFQFKREVAAGSADIEGGTASQFLGQTVRAQIWAMVVGAWCTQAIAQVDGVIPAELVHSRLQCLPIHLHTLPSVYRTFLSFVQILSVASIHYSGAIDRSVTGADAERANLPTPAFYRLCLSLPAETGSVSDRDHG